MLYARPTADDSPPFYFTYIDKVASGDVIETLGTQIDQTIRFLSALDPGLASHRYADGKWSVVEVLGHMADCERIFAYRGLRIARGDQTPIPGFEQDDYVRDADYSGRTIESFCHELQVIRSATICLFENLTPTEIKRTGTASGNTFTAGAHPFIIAGHEAHHVNVLKDLYV